MHANTVSNHKSQAVLRRMQRQEHSGCIFCNATDSLGLILDWQTGVDRDIRAEFCCGGRFQSYDGLVHGGVVSLLFDGVMTNCLFAEGKRAVTGELTIRYLKSVSVGCRLQITARIVRSRSRLHIVEAELRDDEGVLATARAKFMEEASAVPEKPDVST